MQTRQITRSRTFLALALILCVAAPSLLWAGPQGLGDAARERAAWSIGALLERVLERVGDRLEISDGQREQIRAMVEQRREVLREDVEAVLTARRDLFAAIHGESFDEAAIRAAAAVVGAAQADLAVERARLVQEIRGVLTPEQLERVEGLLDAALGFAEALGDS